MSYVDGIKAVEHAKLRGARSAAEALRNGCVPVIRQLTNVYLDTFPPFPFKDRLADEIANKLIVIVQESCDYLLEAIAFLDELVEWLGSPMGLRGAADALLADVAGPASNLQLEIKEAALPSRHSWDDPHVTPDYRDETAGQPDELERLLPFITTLRDILREMADSIETFYIELGLAIVGAVGAVANIVVAVGSSATIVGIPVGIAAGVAAAVSAVGAIGGVISLCVTTSQVQGDLLDSAKSSFTYTWANYAKFALVP